MRVAQLWRYPVKSMQGESVDSLDLLGERVPGDREWGVRDSATGMVLNARTTPPLLHARGHLVGDGVCITLPDGHQLRGGDEETDPALSSYLGRPVHLARAEQGQQSTFEAPVEFSDDTSPLARWTSRPGTFNDGHHLHVLTTASLRAAGALHPNGSWEARRFRPNLVLDVDGDEFVEDGWQALRIGDVELEIYKQTVRCVITARAQPGLEHDLDVPRTLSRNRKAKLGVYARVKVGGRIDAGADVVPS